MSANRTRFYLDRQNRKWSGVCAGIADYTGIDATWIRVAAILLTVAGGFPWTVIAYFVAAWVAEPKPNDLYDDAEGQKFWQGVRSNPKRSTAEIRSTFRDIDRRLADIESYYVGRDSRLSDEIERLR